jgi:hypothetical protein
MSDDTHELAFEEALDDTDYGLIIDGKSGKLKGLWIPRGMDEELVPESIVRICVEVFGIDPKEFDEEFEEEETSDGHTIH